MVQGHESLRILRDAAHSGPENMARDEALLTSVANGSAAALRLYEWSAPTISLGYFQSYAQFQRLPAPECELAVVRRLTGGGAILHDLELTYSVALPMGHPSLGCGPSCLYEIAHHAAAAALLKIGIDATPSGITDDSTATKGPFFCFARRHKLDLLWGAEKIVGSAQRRLKTAVLQHGSIILASRYATQSAAAAPIAIHEAIATLRASFPQLILQEFRMNESPLGWQDSELAAAAALAAKYAGDDWTRRS